MSGTSGDLARYRIHRALATLTEAELLLREGHANTFINRLYYACFYAASAWLALKGLTSSKHSGIRSLFHQHMVKAGPMTPEEAVLYDRLYHHRQKADYVDFAVFRTEDVGSWLHEAQAFVQKIHIILEKEI